MSVETRREKKRRHGSKGDKKNWCNQVSIWTKQIKKIL